MVFLLTRCVIGLENSRHFLGKSDFEPIPLATWSPAFSRASGFRFFKFSLDPGDIFLLVIGCCDCLGFEFGLSIERNFIVYFSFDFFLAPHKREVVE